jgi:AcrR family transcriptional regulator
MPARFLDTDEYVIDLRVWQGSPMTLEPLTPERRRELTRRHLLEAAAVVFARDGFHGARLDDVAALAGFTKGAVYSNFTSKDDLFLALLDDRVDTQVAITTEVLEQGPHEREAQFPVIRELLHSTLLGDDGFAVLYLEFVLYARRNPAAREKLIASARRERSLIESMIGREQGNVDAVPPYPVRTLAEFSRALFNGMSLTRILDPEAITESTLDDTLDMLYKAMGADGEPAP